MPAAHCPMCERPTSDAPSVLCAVANHPEFVKRVRAIRIEAQAAGDGAQERLCDQAIRGDLLAAARCWQTICDAEASRHSLPY